MFLLGRLPMPQTRRGDFGNTPLLFPCKGVVRKQHTRKKENKMNAVKKVIKVIWWIIRIPILPIIIGWNKSKGKGKGFALSFSTNGKETTVSSSLLGRLLSFILYAAFYYAIMFVVVGALAIAYGLVERELKEKFNNKTTPAVDQVNTTEKASN